MTIPARQGGFSKSELDEMVEEALVDAYGESEQVRNLSPHAQKTYIEQVSRFARYFGKFPMELGFAEIRSFQLYLTNEKKLAAQSIIVAVAALLFLYGVTLHKDWNFRQIIPHLKKPQT